MYVPTAQPAGLGVRRHPHVLGEPAAVLELEVVRTVLEAHQVARRLLGAARRGRPAEAELRPAHHDRAATDPRQVPDRVERHLRVVRASLDGEVAAGALRVELVPGEGG
jgi:hypothetical protein